MNSLLLLLFLLTIKMVMISDIINKDSEKESLQFLGSLHIFLLLPVIASMKDFLSTEFRRYLMMFTVLHSKGHPRRFSKK